MGTTAEELSRQGADGRTFLATLVRSEPHLDYQVLFLNNGRTALAPASEIRRNPSKTRRAFAAYEPGRAEYPFATSLDPSDYAYLR